MTITLACDQIPTPPASDAGMEEVPALLLSPHHPPRQMRVPRHAHRIEFDCGHRYHHSRELSRVFEQDTFVLEGLDRLTITFAISQPVHPTETLPAHEDRLHPRL